MNLSKEGGKEEVRGRESLEGGRKGRGEGKGISLRREERKR